MYMVHKCFHAPFNAITVFISFSHLTAILYFLCNLEDQPNAYFYLMFSLFCLPWASHSEFSAEIKFFTWKSMYQFLHWPSVFLLVAGEERNIWLFQMSGALKYITVKFEQARNKNSNTEIHRPNFDIQLPIWMMAIFLKINWI